MKVYWLEQSEADVPGDHEWLSARERVQLGTLRFPRRRADWLLGRWTAKQAVASYLELPTDLQNLAHTEIHSRASGAPETFLGEQQAPVTISLSHRGGRAVCAVTADHGTLGCDLEVIEPRSRAFVADYFASEEQALVARAAPADRPWLVTLIWSAKESALKALLAGLRLDTRCVIVSLDDSAGSRNEDGEFCGQPGYADDRDLPPRQLGAVNSWHPLRVRHLNDRAFLGWWQDTGNLMRTIVGSPPPRRPRLLEIRAASASTPWDARLSKAA